MSKNKQVSKKKRDLQATLHLPNDWLAFFQKEADEESLRLGTLLKKIVSLEVDKEIEKENKTA